MGGQVADHGTISDAAGTVVARVVDVQRVHQMVNLFIPLRLKVNL